MESSHLPGPDPHTVRKQIAEIWRQALDVPEGEAGASFFELGGQSISALLIVAWLEDELGITSVDVGDLFEDPDLDTFIEHVVAKLELAVA